MIIRLMIDVFLQKGVLESDFNNRAVIRGSVSLSNLSDPKKERGNLLVTKLIVQGSLVTPSPKFKMVLMSSMNPRLKGYLGSSAKEKSPHISITTLVVGRLILILL